MKKIAIFLVLMSLPFVSLAKKEKTEIAIFAGGCFWGVEYFMQQCDGVISTTAGLIGGTDEVEDAEAVEVVFDPRTVSYKTLAQLFFEIHDPTQLNRQGEDEGVEYRSEVFYTNNKQKKIAEKLISILRKKGYGVVTKLTPASEFIAEVEGHQDYYKRKGTLPSCHARVSRF